jgi:hypothetical protein
MLDGDSSSSPHTPPRLILDRRHSTEPLPHLDQATMATQG